MSLSGTSLIGIGVDIGGTKCIVRIDTKHDGMQQNLVQLRIDTGSSFTIHAAEKIIQEAIGAVAIGTGYKFCAAVAICGLLKKNEEEMYEVTSFCECPLLEGWVPERFFTSFVELVSFRVVNDTDAGLYGALTEISTKFGSPIERITNVAVVIAGTNLALSTHMDGKIVSGCKKLGSEVGTLPYPFSQSDDGKIMTLDEIGGGRALLKKIGKTPEEILSILSSESKDEGYNLETNEIRKHITEAAKALSVALSTTILMFNPAFIIVAGGMTNWPGYFDTALHYTRLLVPLDAYWDSCQIILSSHPNTLVCRGVLELAFL